MQLRDQILRESAAIIATNGLEALSIRAVAQSCQVSIGAVQHHFPTKSDLLLALVDGIGDAIRHQLAAAGQNLGATSSTARLTELAELLGGAVEDAPDHIKIWLAFLAHGLNNEPVARRHQELWAGVERTLATELLHAGAAPAHCADRAALLLAHLDGIAIARAMEPERMPLPRCQRLVHEAVALALRPAEPA